MRTVLILMDTLNRRFLKSYHENAEGITPNMDAFAEEAVRITFPEGIVILMETRD